MLNIYLIRHGETEWNTEKRLQGWKDSSLTQRGIESAEALYHHFSDMEFRRVYSSPSMRAFKTAEIILGEREVEIIADDNLREIALGQWEGKTRAEIEQLDSDQYDHFWNAPHRYRPKDGEEFIQVQNRAMETIHNIVKENESGNILIVTHGITLKLILAYFEKRTLENLWDPPFIENTSVSLVRFEKDEAHIELYADTSHIATAY